MVVESLQEQQLHVGYRGPQTWISALSLDVGNLA